MRAKVPFDFYTSSQLVEITGRKAAHLKQFIEILKGIDDSSIFYHVHHAFREHHFAPGMYTNDFAHWVEEELGEAVLAEKLASINIKDYTEIKALRQKLVEIIEDHLMKAAEIRRAAPGHEFYFCKNVGVIQRTKYDAWDLPEFCANLKKVGLRSLFFHFFEARLRLSRKTNDFSDWIKTQFGEEALARQIEALDPYEYTMDDLRDRIISLISREKVPVWEKVRRWLRSR